MSELTTDQNFNRYLLISTGVHVGIIALSLVVGKIFMSIVKSNDVEIIRASIRVDVVGMPKFTIQELKELEKKANLAPTPEVVKGSKEESKVDSEDVIKKDDLILEEKSKRKSAFLNIISDYSNKKVSKDEREKGVSHGSESKNLDSLIVEGNRLSKGSALVGDYSDEVNSEFSAYVQTLPGIIRQNWKLPSYLKEKDLRCKILLYLGSTGQVIKTSLVESSGHADFDARAEKAVIDSAPFPKPSESFSARLINSGIMLKFPL